MRHGHPGGWVPHPADEAAEVHVEDDRAFGASRHQLTVSVHEGDLGARAPWTGVRRAEGRGCLLLIVPLVRFTHSFSNTRIPGFRIWAPLSGTSRGGTQALHFKAVSRLVGLLGFRTYTAQSPVELHARPWPLGA